MDPRKGAIHRSWVGRYRSFAAGRYDCDYFLDGTTASPDPRATDRTPIDAGNILSAEMLLPQLLDIILSTITQFLIPIIQFSRTPRPNDLSCASVVLAGFTDRPEQAPRLV